MENNNKKHPKSGFTVAELEGHVKKYAIEVGLCAIFVLTMIFSLVWGGAMLFWSIVISMLLAVVGVIFPKPIHKISSKVLRFCMKDKGTGIAALVVGLLFSIFVPLVILAIVGLVAGKSLYLDCRGECSCVTCDKDDHKKSANS